MDFTEIVPHNHVGIMRDKVLIEKDLTSVWRRNDEGGSYRYAISIPGYVVDMQFQRGNPKDEVNGITDESLLSVVLDRLKDTQKTKYATRENALAITKIEEALHWIHHRTLERQARGIEGTKEV